MKIKMLQTRRVARDGRVEEFRKGEVYEVTDQVGTALLTDGAALPVRQRPASQPER
ncbi:MAG: hypothetical protein HQL41_09030 [Alphaproteobacteria bacterium]|nr:hypothetical protein [Alphaproteobacteria bacterium]